MVQKKRAKVKITKEEITKRSKKITNIVREFKAKMQELKKKQDKIIEDYTKSLEKMAIEKVREKLK